MSDTSPTVSVLLPIHGAAATLDTCLRSIRRQQLQSWECIAVDDGSTDASPEILARYARADPRFRVIRTPHLGLVAALQRGLASCRAPLVARMDADDWMHRERLSAQRAFLAARPELIGCGTWVRGFPRDALSDGRRRYEAWLSSLGDVESIRRDAFVECPIVHPSLMIRRRVVCEHGYRDMGWPEDYDLFLRLLNDGHALAVLPRRLLGWRDSPERLSRTDDAYGLDRFTACKAAHLAAGFLARGERYILWGYGDTGRKLRNALLPHGKRPARIVELHPRRLGQRIHGAPVVPPAALARRTGDPLVVSVAGPGPRAEIRAALAAMGYEELRDYVCAA